MGKTNDSETITRADRRRAARVLERRGAQMAQLVVTRRERGNVALLDAIVAMPDDEVRILLATAVAIMVDASTPEPIPNGTTIESPHAEGAAEVADALAVGKPIDVYLIDAAGNTTNIGHVVEVEAIGTRQADVIIDDRPPHLDRDAD